MKKIRGVAQRAFQHGPDGWEMFIGTNEKCFTIQVIEHELKPDEFNCNTTIVTEHTREFYEGLSMAMQDMGLFPKNEVTAELKATKYHLEDMRSLVLNKTSQT